MKYTVNPDGTLNIKETDNTELKNRLEKKYPTKGADKYLKENEDKFDDHKYYK